MGQTVPTEHPTEETIVNVPIRSPMWDGEGTADALGNMTRPWVRFFQELSTGTGGGGGGVPGPAGPPGLPGAPGVSGSYQVAR